ncbi:MAG: hypothetical protein WA782_20085 [Sulfitobacter sp.]
MFAPEGYINFSTMVQFLSDWAHRIYLAHLIEDEGGDPKRVFSEKNLDKDAYSMLSQLRHVRLKQTAPDLTPSKDDKDWSRHLRMIRDDAFYVGIIYYCLLSKALLSLETLIASSDGKVMQPDEAIFLHMDRLDWVYPSWPLRETTEFATIIEYYDAGKFNIHSLSERFCFLDVSLGIIGLKNNSLVGFQRCSHHYDDRHSKRYVKAHVEPFIACSVVWSEEDFPDDFAAFLENIGALPERWDAPQASGSSSAGRRPNVKRGAKPTGAKEEFFRLYPDGKPDELSADAIAAELTEAGFPISGRQILNYAKEIKSK